MQSDGSWKDVNYKDQDRTEWAALAHWARLLTLSVALHCNSCGAAGNKGALLPSTTWSSSKDHIYHN